MLRISAFTMAVLLCFTSQSHAAAQEAEVMKPVNNFFSALARRDKAGMLAEVVPNVEVMSARKGALRRLTIENIANTIATFPGGEVAEPIFDPVIHIDDNLAVVWTPYKFTINGKVDHCGTDVINLLKLSDHWIIVALADNARQDCP